MGPCVCWHHGRRALPGQDQRLAGHARARRPRGIPRPRQCSEAHPSLASASAPAGRARTMRDYLLCGDARQIPLRDGAVQCVVTSPPYWGLRDYGTPGQLGLEPTPEAYIAAMVAVFREVWRVLRDDGTLWLNLGDSYVANASNQVPQTKQHIRSGFAGPNRNGMTGLKAKDLCGIPWRVAFALQADGWVLRSEIIWSKPNPMPESVTDRPTKAHEQFFLFSKAKWVGAGEPPTWMSESDRAWLAALIDGEGTICFQDRAEDGHAPTWSVRLSVVNTNTAL